MALRDVVLQVSVHYQRCILTAVCHRQSDYQGTVALRDVMLQVDVHVLCVCVWTVVCHGAATTREDWPALTMRVL